MDVSAKLQIKAGQSVAVLGEPGGAGLQLPAGTPAVSDPAQADAVIVFCTDRAQLERLHKPVEAAAKRDALAWVAYPKAGQLRTDLNRDRLAALLEPAGIRPVRQVAIDDVWSALRFRKA
jgi:hypothetical protein